MGCSRGLICILDRVALARAVYALTKYVLLDDPLYGSCRIRDKISWLVSFFLLISDRVLIIHSVSFQYLYLRADKFALQSSRGRPFASIRVENNAGQDGALHLYSSQSSAATYGIQQTGPCIQANKRHIVADATAAEQRTRTWRGGIMVIDE